MFARFIVFLFKFKCVRILAVLCMEARREYVEEENVNIAHRILSSISSGKSRDHWQIKGRDRKGVRLILSTHLYRVLLPYAQDGNLIFIGQALEEEGEMLPMHEEEIVRLLRIAITQNDLQNVRTYSSVSLMRGRLECVFGGDVPSELQSLLRDVELKRANSEK